MKDVLAEVGKQEWRSYEVTTLDAYGGGTCILWPLQEHRGGSDGPSRILGVPNNWRKFYPVGP